MEYLYARGKSKCACMQTDISRFNPDAIKDILTRNPFAAEQIQHLIRRETSGRNRQKVLQLLASHAKDILFDPKVSVCVYLRFIFLSRKCPPLAYGEM